MTPEEGQAIIDAVAAGRPIRQDGHKPDRFKLHYHGQTFSGLLGRYPTLDAAVLAAGQRAAATGAKGRYFVSEDNGPWIWRSE